MFFEFFNKHEPALESQGKHIDWEYFQSKAKSELKNISPKTFMDYRTDWFKKEYKKTFNKHVKNRNLKPFSWKKKTKYSSLGPEPVDLSKNISKLVKKEEKFIKQYDFHEISNIDFRGTRTKKELNKIYKNRRLYKWYGFIYILFQTKDINGNLIQYEIKDGKFSTKGGFVIGFSTKSWKNRWYHYKQDALKYGKTQLIHQLISDLHNAGINIDDAFDWKILEICWTDNKLRKREDDWINQLNANNSLIGGLNTLPGGGGGPKVKLPRSILIPYIARGLWQEEIRGKIKKDHGMKLTKDVIHQRIVDYWGSMEEARKKFLKPIFKYLIRHGYSSIFLGNNVFQRDRHTIKNWCIEFWDKTYEVKRGELLKEYLKKLIIQGWEYREIDKRVKGIPWSTINDQIIKWWEGLKKARELFMKPLIAKSLSNSLKPLKIAKMLGHDDIDRVRKFIGVFWGIQTNLKGDWKLINKFRAYITKNRLTTEEIMQLSEEDIKKKIY